ncbi:MAG: VWA domain-containing protein [Eubacteriaceae bacterium]|nr:VWA domain-containing protein [Eubacteriaceae bacterium]
MNTNILQNSAKRMPIALCLDVSPSMGMKKRIEHLNIAVKMFFKSLKDDPKVLSSAEIAIVCFSTGVVADRDFRYLDAFPIPRFAPVKKGRTNMAAGIQRALEKIRDHKYILDTSEIEYHVPFLIVITDGNPDNNDDKELLGKVVEELKELGHLPESEQIVPIIVGVGDESDSDKLDEIASGFAVKALRVNSLDEEENLFTDIFTFISKSVLYSVKGDRNASEQIKATLAGYNQLQEQFEQAKLRSVF